MRTKTKYRTQHKINRSCNIYLFVTELATIKLPLRVGPRLASRFRASRFRAARYRASRKLPARRHDTVVHACSTVTPRPVKSRLATLYAIRVWSRQWNEMRLYCKFSIYFDCFNWEIPPNTIIMEAHAKSFKNNQQVSHVLLRWWPVAECLRLSCYVQ